MNWCILIPALVGIISALLGYFLGKSINKSCSIDLSELQQKNEKLEADLKNCRNKLSGESRTAASTSSSVSSSFASRETSAGETSKLDDTRQSTHEADEAVSLSSSGIIVSESLSFDADAAKAVFGKKIKQDDLTVVEGIGPKIKELFHNHDVNTWKGLSECSVDKCQSVLNSGGERFKIHKSGTWPMQAKMAYEGKWAELLKWQDEHDGGKA